MTLKASQKRTCYYSIAFAVHEKLLRGGNCKVSLARVKLSP